MSEINKECGVGHLSYWILNPYLKLIKNLNGNEFV